MAHLALRNISMFRFEALKVVLGIVDNFRGNQCLDARWAEANTQRFMGLKTMLFHLHPFLMNFILCREIKLKLLRAVV